MNLSHAGSAWLLASVVVCIPACNTAPKAPVADPQPTVAAPEPAPAERLAVGGAIEITDEVNAELRVTRTVDSDGTVLLPELGHVSLAGLTRPEIETVLREKYSAYFEQLRLYVRILPTGKQYFVFGAVAAQGGQQFTGDMTIFDAVTKAQPRKNSTNLGRVRLIRADPVHPLDATIDLQHIIETGDSTYNVHVQEHDVIVVPAVEPKR